MIKSKFVLLSVVLKYCCVVKCKELEEVYIFVGRKARRIWKQIFRDFVVQDKMPNKQQNECYLKDMYQYFSLEYC